MSNLIEKVGLPLKHPLVLVTGGLGYIGSHAVVELIASGYFVVIVDNLSNSSLQVLDRIELITGIKPQFYNIDIRDKANLANVFKQHNIDFVIHFAGSKAVGESVEKPLEYYDNNVLGSIYLLEVMQQFNVKRFVFSSSATVYGVPKQNPVKEDFDLGPFNPYGRTKLIVEQVLSDLYISDNKWSIAILRYFNPVGAHRSGLIGESPSGVPNNLMPYITQVAIGQLPFLNIYGNDYSTHDGTGVRDYIHVLDLAIGHVQALEYFMEKNPVDGAVVNDSKEQIHSSYLIRSGLIKVNLGTGIGYSVLDVVKAFESATMVSVPYKILPRREGDIDIYYADPSYAALLIGFKAKFTLEDMCRDGWKFQAQNPYGYDAK